MRSKYTPKCENLLHQKFNRLTAIGYAGKNRSDKNTWLWRCGCGKLHIASAADVKSQRTKSCGCLKLQHLLRRNTSNRTHGAARNGLQTPEYRIWGGMHTRCFNPNDAHYADYGGRGITVCDRWKDSFENFLADMGPRPTPKHTIERTNNDGNYELNNCVWATFYTQSRNKRSNHMVTYNGETLCVTDWAPRLGLTVACLFMRLRKWTIEDAFTRPLRPY